MPRTRNVAMAIEWVRAQEERMTFTVIILQQNDISRFDLPRLSVQNAAQFALIANLINRPLLFCFENKENRSTK